MAISRLGRTAVAASGLAALAAVVIWFGILPRAPEPRRSPPGGETSTGRGAGSSTPEAQPAQPAPATTAPPAEAGRAEPSAPAAAPGPAPAVGEPAAAAREAPVAPSFDVVRVEPTGESVIAGRAAPGATVELLRNGKSHARVASDAAGLFAFVPPPFPPGSHEVILQSIAPDGTRTRSQSSITVAIAEKKDTKPLIALTTPDKPTVVLSSPQAPGAAGTKPEEPAARTAALPTAQPPAPGAAPAVTPAPRPGETPAAGSRASGAVPRAQVRVATVEAEEGGRLFVSGEAAPGATVRLYLNDTLIAPGGAGADGRVSFAIGRGVRPGGYRVRLDDVDPVTGEVKSRAEVEFRVPGSLTVELPPAAQPYVTSAPPQPPRRPAETVETTVPAPPPAAAGQPSASGEAGLPRTALAPQAVPAKAPTTVPRLPDPAAATATAPAPAAAAPPSGERQREPATVVIPEINTASVSRGDNLWRISRRVYGRGVRYTVIYSANQDQIRSPRLIYPGQVFVLPPDTPADAQR
ncbi:MAG: LysM peptidoglycan-binding domain-containing protein [Microvirga sp.]